MAEDPLPPKEPKLSGIWKVIAKAIAEVIIYGALINYAVAFIFNFPINYFTIPAYGIAWHFIKTEIPFAVSRYRRG
jgi:hypothetical protein